LQATTEPYAAVLNTDISFPHDAIGTLITELNADPDAVLACPKLLRPDDSEQPAAVPEPTLATELLNRSLARRVLLKSLDPAKTNRVPSVVGPCMIVHMERLKPIGGLDERYFFFMEETDWCRRIREAGGQVIWVPQARVYHLQGASANQRPYRARIQFYESRYIYFAKHYGMVANTCLATGLFLRLIVNMLDSALLAVLTLGKAKHRDKLAVYARLWWWHLRGCPRGESFDLRQLD
jgi:GT2 family glycosyltransferase